MSDKLLYNELIHLVTGSQQVKDHLTLCYKAYLFKRIAQ